MYLPFGEGRDIPYFILKEIVTASPQDLLNFRTDNSHKPKIINNR